MKSVFTKSILIASISMSLAGYAHAVADSTTGNGALNGTPLIPLKYQERETPVTNNITNTTQQITQVIQPSISTSYGVGDGFRFANAYAGCGGAVMVGGGGTCQAADGYAAMPTSQPNGNGWQVVCDALL